MNQKKSSKDFAFVFTLLCVLLSALFSLCTLSFSCDVSLLAFPISAIFSVTFAYFSIFRFYKRGEKQFLNVVLEFLQYLPFVQLVAFIVRRAGEKDSPYFLDLISVFLWCAFLLLSIFALSKLKKQKVSTPKRSGAKKILFEALSWIDALVQAVFMVLLLNIFLVQLYEIPSESMVPEFLINDRVVVFKTPSGPKFPLSKIGFPYLKKYKRGDIVVFRNPHYSTDRKSEVKTVTSQLLYMATLTLLNINRDEFGELKADPLVKRITGLPGEQLLMVDGVLYAKKIGEKDFSIVSEDAKWAEYNLNKTKKSVREKIHEFVLTEKQISMLEECEKMRKNLDLNECATECKKIFEEFAILAKKIEGFASENVEKTKIFTNEDFFEYYLFQKNEELTRKIINSKEGLEFFRDFLCDWCKKSELYAENGIICKDLYSDCVFRLNVMIKICFGKIALRNAELFLSRADDSSRYFDAQKKFLLEEAEILNNYVMILDRRAMPIFPPNAQDGSPQFIPENSYFLMGDNRFNSLDMRHSYEERLVALTPLDDFSVKYYSNIAPQFVPREKILGTTALRFWPLSRFGRPN